MWGTLKKATAEADNCNTGKQPCTMGKLANITIVPVKPAEAETHKKLVEGAVLAGWAKRCGAECAGSGTTPSARRSGCKRRRTDRPLQRLTRYGLWFGGALVLLAALLIGVDVTLRKFFQTSIGGADELAGYALASAPPGRSAPRCSSARTSASTRCTCCSRAGCASRSISSGSRCSRVLRPDRVARLERGAAVLGLRLAQPVGAADADRDPAGDLARGAGAVLPSGPCPSCPRRAAGLARRGGGGRAS